MNLNKFTKAELISKFKKLDNKNNNNQQTLTQTILNTLTLFKNMLYKFTILTLLIKTFKKYSIFRRLWLILNTIVMSIFGISILDFYGLSFIASFFTEFTSVVSSLVNYLTNTHFYSVLSGLFSQKVEVKPSTNILGMGTNNNSSTGSETSIENNSKINEWLSRKEIIQEPESDNRKYYIIAALLLLSCLAWYYYGDDIKPLPGIALEKIKSFRRKPESTDGNNVTTYDNNDLSNSSWKDSLQNISNKIKSKFRKDDDNTFKENLWSYWDDFENKFKFSKDLKKQKLKTEVKNKFIDNPQAEANSSKIKLEDLNREEYNNYFNQEKLEVFQQITGNNFNKEADSVLKEASQFLDYIEKAKFPKTEIKDALYKNISDRFFKLNEKYPDEYNNKILNHEGYNNLVESFFKVNEIPNLDTKPLSPIAESDTYNEIALATVHEQEVWSDKAASPSIHSQQVNSPSIHSVHSPILEDQNQSMLGEFLQRQNEFVNQQDINQQISEEINKGIPSIDARSSLLDAIKSRRNDSHVIDEFNKELPEIDINSASNSNSSIENILPEQVSKPKFNALFDAIKAKRDDSNVVESPGVSNIGLTPILDKIKGLFSPKTESKPLDVLNKGKSVDNTLDNKPSISNLLDDTNALFDDLDTDIPINIVDNNIDNNYVKNIWSNVEWDNRYLTILDNTSLNVNLNDIWQIVKNIHITTNENHYITYKFEDLNFNSLNDKIVKLDILDRLPKILNDFPNTKVNSVIIEDLNGNYNTISIV